jgi:hypothetical protein
MAAENDVPRSVLSPLVVLVEGTSGIWMSWAGTETSILDTKEEAGPHTGGRRFASA